MFGGLVLVAAVLAQVPVRSWVSTSTSTVTRTRETKRITADVVSGVPQSVTILYTETKTDASGVISVQNGEWKITLDDVDTWKDTLANGATNGTKAFFKGLFTRLDGVPEQAVLAWNQPERVTPK